MAVVGLFALGACAGDRVASPNVPAVGRAPSLRGVILDASVLAEMRQEAWGCTLMQPAGDSLYRVLSLKYHVLPFPLLRRLLPQPDGAPAVMVNAVRRLKAGEEFVNITCAVPIGYTGEHLRYDINASAGPRWDAIAFVLSNQPPRALTFAAPLPAEAIQVRWELLGEDVGGAMLGAGAMPGAEEGLPGSSAPGAEMPVGARLSTVPLLRASCDQIPPPVVYPTEPLIGPPLQLPQPSTPRPLPLPGEIANRVRADLSVPNAPRRSTDPCSGGDPIFGIGGGMIDGPYDPYGGYQEPRYGGHRLGEIPEPTGEEFLPCYYECATPQPPTQTWRPKCPGWDAGTCSSPTAAERQRIQTEANRLKNLTRKPTCQHLGRAIEHYLNASTILLRPAGYVIDRVLQPGTGVSGVPPVYNYEYNWGEFTEWSSHPDGLYDTQNMWHRGGFWASRDFKNQVTGEQRSLEQVIRHEAAHGLLFTSPSGGYTFPMDVPQKNGPATAESIAKQCA